MVILKNQTVKRSIFAFFSTEAGQKVGQFGAGVTMVGLFLGNFVPQTFGLKYYQDFVQSYENGVARPVPEKVRQRFEMAMEKLKVPDFEKAFIKSFTVFGFDIFQAGSTKHKTGALIGIPVNYSYNTESDIKRSEIRFRDESLDWNSEAGKLLQEAIVLKDDEQIFAMSKAILQCQTQRVLFNALYPSMSFLTVYAIGRYLNLSLKLFARPLSLRMLMYSILGLFGFGLWSFAKDFSEVSYDAEVDKKLSEMGPEFIDAGIRFYDKNLKKNIALRKLLKDDTYTAMGNVNYLIRQKSLPLTIRKSFFEQKFKELQDQNTDETSLAN